MLRKKENLPRNVSKVSAGTLLSRISGLIRDIFLTHFLGTTWVADCFGIAFVIPNMLRGLFGEGALAAAFIPSYTEFLENRSKKEAIRLAVNLLSVVMIVLVFLVLLGILLAPLIVKVIAPGLSTQAKALTTQLTQILFPYLFLIGLTSIIISILNAHSIFFFPSLSPIMLNLGIICPILVYSFLTDSTIVDKSFIFAGGVILGGIWQLLVNWYIIRKVGYRLKFYINLKQKELKSIWKRIIPGIIGLGIREVNVVVDTLLASLLITGSVAALQYGNRLMQLPLGVFGIAIGIAVLPLFSKHTALKNKIELKRSIRDAFNMILILMLPIIAIILVMGKDIISLIFQHGEFGEKALNMTFSALAFYAIGLISHSSVKIFSSAFFALKDTRTPVKISVIAVITNVILNIILMHFLQLRGLALATSIAATIQATILFIVLQKNIGRINFKKIVWNFLKLTFISFIIGFVVYNLKDIIFIKDYLSRMFLFLKIMILLLISALIYLIGLKILKVDSAQRILDSFKRW